MVGIIDSFFINDNKHIFNTALILFDHLIKPTVDWGELIEGMMIFGSSIQIWEIGDNCDLFWRIAKKFWS